MSAFNSMFYAVVVCIGLVVTTTAAVAAPQDGFGDTNKGNGAQAPAAGAGACCLGDGSCLTLPLMSCDILVGQFQGVGSDCIDVVCIPFGACCMPDLSCQNVTMRECTIMEGNYQGDAIKCALGLCPVQGACCLDDGSCLEAVSEEQCALQSGIYRGFQTECASVVCTGGCSFEDRTCTDGLSNDACDAAGGNFLGVGSMCANFNIPAIVQCQTFSFDQNNIETRSFAQFDTMDGDRMLQKVSVILDGEIVAVVVLTNLAVVPKDDTDVFVIENLRIEMPDTVPIFDFPAIDVVNDIISCGFSLPPGESCDFGSPLTFPGTGMGMTMDPGDLATFTGDGTIDADIPALGSFEFFGSKFSLENNPHLAQGKITLVYEYIVPGACCFPDFSCTDVDSEADCAAAGGTFQGAGTVCTPDLCGVPACCLPDGSCQQLSEADCALAGGVSQGDGSVCVDVECPTACCLLDGTCVFVTPTACADLGGDSQLGACVAVECPTACCLPDGSCVFVTPTACEAQGGVSQLGACADVECPTACCLPDGSCVFVTPTQCLLQGGASQAGACADVECPTACCLPDGSCVFVTPTACAAQGGDSQLGACDDVECPRACCFPDGSCVFQTPSSCVADGGVAREIGETCGVVVCPLAEGCCFPSGSCQDLLPDDCIDAGGIPQGAGTLCADPIVCPEQPDRGGCTEKGSLLVFSKVELRWKEDGENGIVLTQDTFISITNDFPGNVKVHMYFINGDAPLEEDEANDERAHQGWNWVDNTISLTGNEPTYWSAFTGQPKGVSPFTALDPGSPPGRPALDGTGDRVLRGYVLAWAINNVGDEIRWNHLSGHGTVIRYDDNHAWEYNACAYQVNEDLFDHGQATGTPGVLTLNGTEYALFADLLLNFQAATSNAFNPPNPPPSIVSDTDLTLHPLTVDVRQNNDGPITTKASMDIWNENETKFSGTHRCITCWDQTLISMYELPNNFLEMFLQTDHGKARISGVAAFECDEPDDPGTPEDESVTSVPAALLGVHARLLEFNADGFPTAAAGGNIYGMGFENAVIQYDPTSPPPESLLPPDPTPKEIEAFIDALLRSYGGQETGSSNGASGG